MKWIKNFERSLIRTFEVFFLLILVFMNLGFLIRLFLCIFIFGIHLYKFVDKQNELTELRLRIPPLAQMVREIEEENKSLQYEIDAFESPSRLMEFARRPEFAHLKHPLSTEVLVIRVPVEQE